MKKKESLNLALMTNKSNNYRRLVNVIREEDGIVYASIWRPGHNGFRERGGSPKPHWTITYKCTDVSLGREEKNIRLFISKLPKGGKPVL